MAIRNQKAVITAKVQASEGVFDEPASSDAFLVETNGFPVNFNPQNVTTNEARESLDASAPIPGGIQAEIVFSAFLKGSGTAGAAPDYGALMQGLGFTETILAADNALGQPQAATTNTVTLPVGASTVDDFYNGQPIQITGDDAAVFMSVVTDYDGSTLVATLADTFAVAPSVGVGATVDILAHVLYKPQSGAIPFLSMNVFVDGTQYQFKDVRGTASITGTAGGVFAISYTFSALFVDKKDAAVPSVTRDSTRPPVWKNDDGVAGAFTIDGVPVGLSEFSLDIGNTLIFPPNPNESEGFAGAEITQRNLTGNIDPQAALIATRNVLQDFKDSNRRRLHGRCGKTSGNKIAVTVPEGQYTNYTPGDREGLKTDAAPYFADGVDRGALVAIY